MSDSGFTESNKWEQPLTPAKRSAAAFWPWILIMAVLALALAWRGLVKAPAVEEEGLGRRHPAVGTKLTDLELVPLTGSPQPVALADLSGKVTLINLWGPWCHFCKVEFPHLVEMEKHFRNSSDFRLLSISTNPDPNYTQGLAEQTAQFLKQQGAEFPTFHDPAGKSQRALIQAASLSDFGYPATLVVDRQLTIRGIWIGYRPGDERSVRETVETALSGEATRSRELTDSSSPA